MIASIPSQAHASQRREAIEQADWHGDSLPLLPLLRYTIDMNLHVDKIAPRFRGLWVALADDRGTVLASGKTAEEVFKKAQKKSPETLILTHLAEEDEIPNDDLIAAIKEGEEYLKSGNRKVYHTVDEMMEALR